jgi:enoyl-CoA hydratase
MNERSGHLHVTDDGSVRTIEIDRPEAKNSLSGAMRAELCELFAAADHDPDVTAVVLAAVDPVFSAGVDFKDVTPNYDAAAARFATNPGRSLRAMRTPVICAVNGACVSGALEIALSSSFVVASERARFADTHARLGVVATWGLTALLPRAIGVRKAREMSITGNFVDAATALTIGLVNHVVAHEELRPFAARLAADIAATPAVGEVLSLYTRGEDLSLAAALELEAEVTSGRAVDLAAFRAAGEATARRQRSPDG